MNLQQEAEEKYPGTNIHYVSGWKVDLNEELRAAYIASREGLPNWEDVFEKAKELSDINFDGLHFSFNEFKKIIEFAQSTKK